VLQASETSIHSRKWHECLLWSETWVPRGWVWGASRLLLTSSTARLSLSRLETSFANLFMLINEGASRRMAVSAQIVISILTSDSE
jgi:hypothetical protein